MIYVWSHDSVGLGEDADAPAGRALAALRAIDLDVLVASRRERDGVGVARGAGPPTPARSQLSRCRPAQVARLLCDAARAPSGRRVPLAGAERWTAAGHLIGTGARSAHLAWPPP
ncbi:hypothetical protein ACFQX7_10130 [Luedemannella flava]